MSLGRRSVCISASDALCPHHLQTKLHFWAGLFGLCLFSKCGESCDNPRYRKHTPRRKGVGASDLFFFLSYQTCVSLNTEARHCYAYIFPKRMHFSENRTVTQNATTQHTTRETQGCRRTQNNSTTTLWRGALVELARAKANPRWRKARGKRRTRHRSVKHGLHRIGVITQASVGCGRLWNALVV